MMQRRSCLIAIAIATALPLRALAATADRPLRLGVLEYGDAPESAQTRRVLELLGRFGWHEGSTLRVERRFAAAQQGRIEALLRELGAVSIDLLFAPGHDIAKVAKSALPGVPIVTVGSEDPVRSGLIDSFSRPGGSVTGVSFMSPELASKRLEMLRDVVPGLARVAVLWEPGHVDTYYDELGKVATAIGVRLQMETLASAADLEPAFAALRQPQALFVVPSRLTSLLTQRIVDLALAAKLPTMSAYEAFAAAGGLMSYGAASADVLGRVAALIDRVLNGARPADTPFELPTRFVLTVNLKTARRLGLALPQSLLLRADDVIE